MADFMRGYIPHLQMFPDMAESISASVGLGFCANSAVAHIICPDWQYPHCGTFSEIQAACTGCSFSGEPMPSIVVIFLPSAAEAGVRHDLVATPSICTVQAPHRPIPQPNLVPGRPRSSLRAQRRGVSGDTSAVRDLELTFNIIIFEFSTAVSSCYLNSIFTLSCLHLILHLMCLLPPVTLLHAPKIHQ